MLLSIFTKRNIGDILRRLLEVKLFWRTLKNVMNKSQEVGDFQWK